MIDVSVLHDAEVNGLSQSQIDAKWGSGTSQNLQSYYDTYSGNVGSADTATRSLNTAKTAVATPKYTNQ